MSGKNVAIGKLVQEAFNKLPEDEPINYVRLMKLWKAKPYENVGGKGGSNDAWDEFAARFRHYYKLLPYASSVKVNACLEVFLGETNALCKDGHHVPLFESLVRSLFEEMDRAVKAIDEADASKRSYKPGVEISFASKVIATFDPDRPIYDSFVRKALKREDVLAAFGFGVREFRVVAPYATDSMKRIQQAVSSYEELERFYSVVKGNSCWKEFIRAFRKQFKGCEQDISDVKAIDFMLWALGHE